MPDYTSIGTSAGFSVDLSGRTAVVTGSSKGIGRAISELLLSNGARVIGLQRTDGLQHENYRAIPVDLSDRRSVSQATALLVKEEQVDILVNNAGINLRHKFEEFPLSDWDQVMQVNLSTTVQLTQELGAPMLERGSGHIVNIASMLSFFGGFTASAYAASKGAIAQLTKSVANEWAGRGVNVNAIAPGFIATEMNEALLRDEVRNRQITERIPAGRWGKPADIAGAVLFLVSPFAEYVHGTVLPVDGGYLGR